MSENILKDLKANPDKTLVIKSETAVNGTSTNVTSAIEIKSTADGQIQFTENNVALTGFKTVGNSEYYLNANGIMQTGFVKLPGDTSYYLNPVTGVKETGWAKDNGTWYYLDKTSGVMKTGWAKDNGSWYYLNADGTMQTEWLKDSDGRWYYLNSDGAMANNTTIYD